MIYITNSDKRANFKKFYVIIFLLGAISLLTGFVLTSLIDFIPSVDIGDPGREEYLELIANLGTMSTLFMNIGLGLFLMATFIGATTDKRFSTELKKGLLIASVLGVSALVLFNYLYLYFRIT
ncbi:MAG: hypothetical protein EAX91_06075 [Candidatus Lokiarchaeota archaeon]|nr:hypothetical protein [Candidatus Lokiarchaeota archaeon]